ncbi:MAG: hypothetical protein H8K05_16285 [Nitrospira sp.]|nr:hypothetical protein [Nitrospira sp.]
MRGHQFGVEFIRLPLEAQQRLHRTLRTELIEWLKKRQTGGDGSGASEQDA